MLQNKRRLTSVSKQFNYSCYPFFKANLCLDFELIIYSKMSKINGEWQCTDCMKTSKVKTNIYEHIEATHVETPGYSCEICAKFCRTRNALRNHKNLRHKLK